MTPDVEDEDLLEPVREILARYRAAMAAKDKLIADLKIENASLWESVHEAQDAVTELRSMLERQVA